MVLPKPNEDTITSILNDELNLVSIKSMTFPSLTTPVGTRKPDLYCQDGGNYVIEAKFTQKELTSAIAKIQNDYLKHCKILNLRGGFALLHPLGLANRMSVEQLNRAVKSAKFQLVEMFPAEDARNFNVISGTLSEIVREISKQVLTPPQTTPPSPTFLQLALRTAAQELAEGLKGIKAKQLEDLFGGKNVFMSILHYKSESEYPQQNMRLAAAFLLVNQLLFYHVLATASPKIIPDLQGIDPDKLSKPVDVLPYFAKVTKKDYKAIFAYRIASLLKKKNTDKLRSTISVIQGITPQKIRSDLLGTIFHDLIPLDIRKEVAAYYTNIVAAELLADLAIDKPEESVADFACGSGGLIVGAYKHKRNLIEDQRSFASADHAQFVENDLLGVDVMPFAANVAACHVALQSPQYFTDKVQIAVWDSTDLPLSGKIPSVAEVSKVLTGQQKIESFFSKSDLSKDGRVKKGVVRLAGKAADIQLKLYDCVMMNPPFTRQEKIGTKEYKDELVRRFSKYSSYLDGHMGYFGYFIFQADKFLKPDGKIAFVLPATTLRIRSCKGIREFLSENYAIEHLIASWNRSAFSENTAFREFLLVARKLNKEIQDESNEALLKTKVSIVKEMPTSGEAALELAERIRSNSEIESEDLAVHMFPYPELKENKSNWFIFIAVKNRELIDQLKSLVLRNKLLVPLSSFAEAIRSDLGTFKVSDFHGFVIKNRSRAEKAIDVWICESESTTSIKAAHKQLDERVSIPLTSLERGMRRMAYFKRMDVTTDSDYLILRPFESLGKMVSKVFPSKQVPKVESSLPEWVKRFEKRKTNILYSRRFDISAPGTSLLAYYSDVPVVGIDFWSILLRHSSTYSPIPPSTYPMAPSQAKALTIWLNSTLGLWQVIVLRTETRGAWLKIHDYMLEEIVVPDPKASNLFEKQASELFDQLKAYQFPSILEQLQKKDEFRRKMDCICLDAIGFVDDKDKFLDKLYGMLAEEILILRDILKETGEIPEEEESPGT